MLYKKCQDGYILCDAYFNLVSKEFSVGAGVGYYDASYSSDRTA